MQQNSLKFSSLPLALAYIGTKLSIPMKNYKKNSALIENLISQKKITQWF